jgi:two-component system invasion response regulator UvrY
MATKKIRIIVIDDHDIMREGLKQILGETQAIEVVAEGENGVQAVQVAVKHKADVMLLDISLPDKNGVEVLKQIKKVNPQIAVLMLSMYREDQYAVRALKGGAAGYLSKQKASAELVNAIQTVANGKKYITPEVAMTLADQVGVDEEKAAHELLSDREFQTMTMIASGLTVGDIALKLNLSVKTVSMYRTRILEKMNLRHNAEITHYAIKNKIVE